MSVFRFVSSIAILLFAVGSVVAHADSWDPPERRVITSANGTHRVTIVPVDMGGDEPVPDAREQPYARVERRAGGKWQSVWEESLVNRVSPINALIANDGSYLVTFNNWGQVGRGDDVVVIYDRRGQLLYKLALSAILPPRYVRFIRKTSSSTWWLGGFRLVEGDALVELDVTQPGSESSTSEDPVKVRIRLADAAVLTGGPAWDRAMARVNELEAQRQAKWDAKRLAWNTPRPAPASNDRLAWNEFATELGTRLADGASFDTLVYNGDSSPGGVVREVANWKNQTYSYKHYVFVSPVSDRLASALLSALKAREAGSMRGLHLVFFGTPAEGREIEIAAAHTGVRVTLLDRSQPIPPGKPMPAMAPEEFTLDTD